MPTKVSIVNINDFASVQEAIIKAVELIEPDFHFNLLDSKKILLNPNLLTSICRRSAFLS